MKFSLEESKEIQRQLLSILEGYTSDVKIVPSEGGRYRVLVLQRDSDLPELPPGVEVIPGKNSDLAEGVGHVSDPSSSGKDLARPQNETTRTVEPPEEFRMRRRDFQDIVKRFAMTKNRLAIVAASLQKIANRNSEIDRLLESVRETLIHNNYGKTSIMWKLLQRVQRNYDTEATLELLQRMKKAKLEQESIESITRLLNLVQKHPGLAPTPEESDNFRLAKQTGEELALLEKGLNSLTQNLKRLGLAEEANKAHAMASATKDIWTTVTKLED